MNTFNARILEADNTFFDGELVSITVPAVDGEYGVMANHENVVVAVIPGIARYTDVEGNQYQAIVSDGMMRIEDNDVLLLVDSAEHPEELDAQRAKEKEIAAREAMLQKKSVREYTLAEASLKRAIARQSLKRDSIN